MPGQRPEPKKTALYFALSQVGLEMVSPLILGVFLDHYLGWAPWGVIVGAVLGFAGGMYHMVSLLKPPDDPKKDRPS